MNRIRMYTSKHDYFYKKARLSPFVIYIVLFWMYLTSDTVSCWTTENTNNDEFHLEQQKQHNQQLNHPTTGKHIENILFNKNTNEETQRREILYNMHNPENNEYQWSLGDITHTKSSATNHMEAKNGKRINKRKLRKRFRNKNKLNKDETNPDYDETLQKFHRLNNAESKDNLKFIESDKKYFDYFPIEKLELNSNETEGDDIKVIFLSNGDDDDDEDDIGEIDSRSNKIRKQHRKKSKKGSIDASKNTGSNNPLNKSHSSRSKRSAQTSSSILQTDNQIFKRNIADDNVDNIFTTIEQGTIIDQKENLIRKYRNEPNGIAGNNGQYASYGSRNDPCNNRFPRPFNPFIVPIGPFVKYPIRGIYYNPISLPGFTPKQPSSTNGPDSLNNRFGDDSRVVWDIQYIQTPVRRQNAISDTERPSIQRPSTTRRPAPPLIRNPSRDSASPTNRNGESSRPIFSTSSSMSFSQNNQNTLNTPESRVPSTPPSLIRATTTTATTTTTTTTRRPVVRSKTEPSKCVWAIVSCCSRDNPAVRYNCFEQMGCPGAFWDLNPCANEIQDDAIAVADKFFE